MAINRIAFYHLETLLWIARLGTFAAAAARLNTTQPAISARVRELESHLGTALFRREGRAMALTPAGRELVRESEPLWARFQTVLTGCSDIGGARGVVRVGSGEIAAAICLPDFVTALGRDLPNVTLAIDIALTVDLIQQLASGQADMIFGAGPVAHPMLRSTPIGGVDLLWLASPAIASAATAASLVAVQRLAALSPCQGRAGRLPAGHQPGQSVQQCAHDDRYRHARRRRRGLSRSDGAPPSGKRPTRQTARHAALAEDRLSRRRARGRK